MRRVRELPVGLRRSSDERIHVCTDVCIKRFFTHAHVNVRSVASANTNTRVLGSLATPLGASSLVCIASIIRARTSFAYIAALAGQQSSSPFFLYACNVHRYAMCTPDRASDRFAGFDALATRHLLYTYSYTHRNVIGHIWRVAFLGPTKVNLKLSTRNRIDVSVILFLFTTFWTRSLRFGHDR